MPKFLVNELFQYGGLIRRDGQIITITEDALKEEAAKGKHEKTGKFLSGLLNHCVPADEKTAGLIEKLTGVKQEVPEEMDDKDDDEVTPLRKEFDEMGAAYDPRWGVNKLKRELIKEKKLRGL